MKLIELKTMRRLANSPPEPEPSYGCAAAPRQPLPTAMRRGRPIAPCPKLRNLPQQALGKAAGFRPGGGSMHRRAFTFAATAAAVTTGAKPTLAAAPSAKGIRYT